MRFKNQSSFSSFEFNKYQEYLESIAKDCSCFVNPCLHTIKSTVLKRASDKKLFYDNVYNWTSHFMSPGCSKSQWFFILAMGQFFTQSYIKFPHFEVIKPTAMKAPIQHYFFPQLTMLSGSHSQWLQNSNSPKQFQKHYSRM